VYALDDGGRERWHAAFRQARSTCTQLPGFGITGTPVVDPVARTVYAADAFGLLHALDLVTGVQRPGWPVRLYANVANEVVWGALALVAGDVYVPTGSACDRAMEGKVIRVSPATRAASSWTAVPYASGGGGGIWGWGGIAYSGSRDSLLVVTGNAFHGGRNKGKRFRESAGYGERLVELSRDLKVRSASHPRGIKGPLDLDFTGSPLVVAPAGCRELVVATNKNGRLYGWRSDAIGRGSVWSVRVAGPNEFPHISQLAYADDTDSLLVSTYAHLARYDLWHGCTPRRVWSTRIGSDVLNGSPTVAGGVAWLIANQPPALLGLDLGTGRMRYRSPLRAPGFVAPTVVDGRIYAVTMRGDVAAFAVR
jgi:hypothetical protein